MARLYPVAVPRVYGELLRRRRLIPAATAVVEEKLDGYLVAASQGELLTGSGRRLPSWARRGLEEAGLDTARLPAKGLVLIELYGGCVEGSGEGWHRGEECYKTAVLDAGQMPAHASPRETWLARLDPGAKTLAAEKLGAATPRSLTIPVPGPGDLPELLDIFPGREGVVVKLYAAHGHRLPPDTGAKRMGLLAVKMRRAWLSPGASRRFRP